MIGKSDVYRRAIRMLGFFAAMMFVSQRAFAQETAVTRLDLPLGRSYPYRAAEVITRVTVANPAIVDAVVVSEREIVINAAAAGEGDIILWLQSGRRVHFRVQVHTRRGPHADRAGREVRRSPTRCAPRDRASRRSTATRTFALAVGTSAATRTIDPITGRVTIPSLTRYLTVLTDFGTDDLLAFLDAQEQNGNAHLLAEPTIMTANRELATFLAGGEMPIPVVQGGSGGPGGQSACIHSIPGVRYPAQVHAGDRE